MAGEEHELEALKKWWSEHGKGLLAGLGIGLAAVAGWTSWQTWQRTQAETASVRYEQLVDDAAAGEHESALLQAESLVDEFPESAYAPLASLIAARAAVHANDSDRAKRHLEWAAEHAALPELVPVARLRLARLMIDGRDYDGALAELARIESAPFHGRVKELQGDVHYARGDHSAAHDAYQAVLADAELSPSARIRVRMKLDDLGEATSSPSS